MSWVKLDDRFHGNRKTRKAWRLARASVGLYAFSLTYCAQHETDGVVDAEWVEDQLPGAKERTGAVNALVAAGLWVPIEDGDGYRVHDYLEYQDSRAALEARRATDRARKAKGGRNGRPGGTSTKAGDLPQGFQPDSKRNPVTLALASESPDPTRPDPTQKPPTPHRGKPGVPVRPTGKRVRDREQYDADVEVFALAWLPDITPIHAIRAVKGALGLPGAATAASETVAAKARTLLPAEAAA